MYGSPFINDWNQGSYIADGIIKSKPWREEWYGHK